MSGTPAHASGEGPLARRQIVNRPSPQPVTGPPFRTTGCGSRMLWHRAIRAPTPDISGRCDVEQV